ncbi:hypothetical protein ANME2D_03391 [Candidatus Methanoperedens nitroreducens]|uniref:PEF-CTERM protein sorting domain-containing protein n=2 Tax=Candidatus Methanoperedens nitratireducens TaxID=1392998 RepID=A0A062UTX4_9EURY|nr:hypothetical protein ANME2D_03391 [Candidatus Methanoperedens nitroreducens]
MTGVVATADTEAVLIDNSTEHRDDYFDVDTKIYTEGPNLSPSTSYNLTITDQGSSGNQRSIVAQDEGAMDPDTTYIIPEFPTIALPVAAALGIIFIIYNRIIEE